MLNIYRIYIDANIELKNVINKEEQYTIPVFIPHFGCNNDCVFCNQKRISGNLNIQSINEIKLFIEDRLENINNKKKIQIAFFGGSFTGISEEKQIEYLKMANEYIKQGKVNSIRISTRPDYINVKILNLLKKYNVETIELGVQSMDEEILKVSKRGHTSKNVIRAAKLINLFGFELGIQIMIGLPKSSIEKEIDTIQKSLLLKPKVLRIYPVYVIQNSELWDMCINKEYIPLLLDEAAERTALVIEECKSTDVKIIRIGLQSTEEITSKNENVLGPISDNFSDYALSKIILKKIENELILNKIKDRVIEVNINKRYTSLVSGPKKINKKYIEEKYNCNIIVRGE